MRRPLFAGLILSGLACTAVTETGDPEVVGVTGTETGNPESARAAVLAELTDYYGDLSARDWTAFADHFWEGATLTTIWQPPGESAERVVVTSVPEFVAKAPEGPGSKPIFEEWMTSAEVRVTGGLAHAWARYGARFGDPDAVVEWSGIDAFTLLRHDGRWRIVALAYVTDS